MLEQEYNEFMQLLAEAIGNYHCDNFGLLLNVLLTLEEKESKEERIKWLTDLKTELENNKESLIEDLKKGYK